MMEGSDCVVDETGKVLVERKVPTGPDDVILLLTSIGCCDGRVGIRTAFAVAGEWTDGSKTADRVRRDTTHEGTAGGGADQQM
jgi:hypothetical protein